MTFSEPVFLWIGVALALLAVIGLWSQTRRRRRLGDALGGRRASRRLTGSDLYRVHLERILALGLAALVLAAAAAGPAWRESGEPAPPTTRTTVIAIDISASMQAADAVPTRLARAVGVAENLLDVSGGDRVGLLLFAGKAYPIAPPTRDHAALRYLLQGVTHDLASLVDPGTLPSVAIQRSGELLASVEGSAEVERSGELQRSGERRMMVLIGDGGAGESEASILSAAADAASQGIHVFTIGVGGTEGAGMVLPRDYRLGGPVVDAAGVPVVSKLEEESLERIAEAGGGRYARADDGAELARLIDGLLESPAPAAVAEDDAAPWSRLDPISMFLIVALVLLLLEALLDVSLFGGSLSPVRRSA